MNIYPYCFYRAKLAMWLLVVAVIFLSACSDRQDHSVAESPVGMPAPVSPVTSDSVSSDSLILDESFVAEESVIDESVVDGIAAEELVIEAPVITGSGSAPSLPKADNYKVELGVDEFLTLPGTPGELRIWIGSEQAQASFPSGFVSDEVTLAVSGKTATISPFAPDFLIAPATSQCIRVHPSGSEVVFQLTPTQSGDFNVGAKVNLYDTADCSGAPIPKSTARLKVTVTVDGQAVVMGGAIELWSVFWVKLVEFWGAVVALFFALLLFLIRKKLKQWFGFGS